MVHFLVSNAPSGLTFYTIIVDSRSIGWLSRGFIHGKKQIDCLKNRDHCMEVRIKQQAGTENKKRFKDSLIPVFSFGAGANTCFRCLVKIAWVPFKQNDKNGRGMFIYLDGREVVGLVFNAKP